MPVLKEDLPVSYHGNFVLRSGTEVRVSKEDKGTPDEVLLAIEGTNPEERFWADRKTYEKAIGEVLGE